MSYLGTRNRWCSLQLLAIVLAALWAWSPAGWSHAHPEQRSPARGAVLKQAPKAVSIQFSEELEPAFSHIKLTVDKGAAVETAHSHVASGNPRLLVLPVGQLKPGRYVVHWHAVARDGHTTHGQYAFTITPAGSQ